MPAPSVRLIFAETDYLHGIVGKPYTKPWHTTRETGGTSFLLGGCHAIDAIRFLVSKAKNDGLAPEAALEAARSAREQQAAEVYAALMQVRIGGQVAAFDEGRNPDNYVDPTRLTYMDQRILKESFVQIRRFQTRLSYDFTGLPEAPA